MEDAKCQTKIVILDACRNHPFSRKTRGFNGAHRGLTAVKAPTGTFIAYATEPGNVAYDGDKSRNSPYTKALLKYIDKKLSIEQLFKEVRKDVLEETKGMQTTCDSSSLTADFYFNIK
jgi:uncharacterized caspase-like protein